MGLSISHGTFEGAYSAYLRLRQEWFRAAGFPGDLMRDWFMPGMMGSKAKPWEAIDPNNADPLVDLLLHSDADGTIEPEMAERMATRLEGLLPLISGDDGGGHLERDGGYRAVTQRFIRGLRSAAAAKELVVYS